MYVFRRVMSGTITYASPRRISHAIKVIMIRPNPSMNPHDRISDHEYKLPPRSSPRKRHTIAPMNIAAPSKSIFANFCFNVKFRGSLFGDLKPMKPVMMTMAPRAALLD
jgi:hypothetical protein